MEITPEEAAPIIEKIFADVCKLVLEKNASYNASMLRSGRFGPRDPEERIWCRIDDKLNRIEGGHSYPGDNDVRDMIGYLVGLLVIREVKQVNKEK
jgi:hypothetical protein